jgi:membrane-bound metal-dependent hydrolase YbcI (DUF457 family)
MAFAFMHLFAAWIAGKACEHSSKKKLKHLTWILLLFGGILPDIDLIFDWALGTQIHRTFTHSILFVVIISIIAFIIFKVYDNKNANKLTLALATGILVHFIVDMVWAPGINLFWPYQGYIAYTGITFITSAQLKALQVTYESIKAGAKLAILDMAVGVAWLGYLALKKKIKF